MTDSLVVALDDGILTLRLNRPARYNAWTGAMRDRLADLVADADARDDVRALILTGTGDRAFCAGQDLAETERFVGGESVAEWLAHLKRFYDAVRAVRKPVVCALNGLAAGSGFQVAMMTDVVVAHPGVTMGQPEVSSGIPSIFGPWLMAASLGQARTAELAVTGRMMGAEECHRLGLIHHLVPADRVAETARAVARDLAAKPPVAMRLTKAFLRRADQEAYERAFAWAGEGQAEAFATGEPQRVMRAFFEERRRRRLGRSA